MKLSKNIAISETGFVFDPTTGDSYSLNPVAAEILQLLKNNKSIKEVIASVLKKYEVDEPQLEKDIQDFVMSLEQYHLIEQKNEN
ncbi:MAG: hypothetical protein A2053_04130 [Deltaproteobacteria bacterium GWA2_50_8]|nr:MAG: hypothetical protein A2053_04130 [Deltaproteobacteria bacterium GWA2_50_8]